MLTDRDILTYIDKGYMKIDAKPLQSIREKVNGCSVDLFIGDHYYALKDEKIASDLYDMKIEDLFVKTAFTSYLLKPGETISVESLENIELTGNIAGIYKTRFKFSNIGIISQGIVHPGSKGKQVLVIHNIGKHEIELKAGKSIIQLILFKWHQN